MSMSILRTRHVGATSDDKVGGEPHGLLPGILAGVLTDIEVLLCLEYIDRNIVQSK